MSSEQISLSKAILFLQPSERRQYIVDMVGVPGVPGRVIWSAGPSRMVGIRGEAVIDGCYASNAGDQGVFEEEIEGGG